MWAILIVMVLTGVAPSGQSAAVAVRLSAEGTTDTLLPGLQQHPCAANNGGLLPIGAFASPPSVRSESTPDSGHPEEELALSPGAPTQQLAGTWRRTAKSPIAAHEAAGAWTGDSMVVVDPRTGDTAQYFPQDDRWQERAQAPDGFVAGSPTIWTGEELLIITDANGITAGLAYDPETDTWRSTAVSPMGAPATAAWTGDSVVVATSLNAVAAYYPGGDCWERLPSLGGSSRIRALYWTGSSLFAESRLDGPDGEVTFAILDRVAGDWSNRGPFPVSNNSYDGVWIGDRVIYLAWWASDSANTSSASYDPFTNSWQEIRHDCHTQAQDAIWTGSMLFAGNGRRAYDPDSGNCYQIERPPVRLLGGDVLVWTGSELISWSGIAALPEQPRPQGVIFRPGSVGE